MVNQNKTVSPAELGAEFQKFAITQNRSEVALLAASQKSVGSANQMAQSMQSDAKQLMGWSIAAGVLTAIGLALGPVGCYFGAASMAGGFNAIEKGLTMGLRGATATGSVVTGIGQGIMQSQVDTNSATATSLMKNGQQNAKGVQTLQKSNEQIMRTAASEYVVNAVVVQAA